MSGHSTLQFTLVALSLFVLTLAINPGAKLRITKKAINYASQVAQKNLNKNLNNLKIGDQSGSEHHFSWSLTGIQNRGVTIPSSVISLDQSKNGLDWAISNLGLNLKANWRVKYKKGWIKASTSGSVDLGIKGASVSVAIALGKDATGHPTIRSAACSSHIADVNLHFHGGTAWLINLFRHKLEDKVKDKLQGLICNVVNKNINEDGEAALKKVKVTVEMAHKFLLDYRLTAAPKVTTQYLESQHKGEIYWLKDQKEAPFSPLPIPPSTDVSKMLYIWLTEFTANSYAFAAQSHNFLKRNFTSMDLPPGNRSLLNTTCTSVSKFCIGKLIPQIGKACPNSVVYSQVSSTLSPALKFSNQSVILTAQGNIDLFATNLKKKDIFLMTLNMTVSLNLKGKIEKNMLVGEISSKTFKFGVVKSDIGDISSRAMNMILNIAMDTAVIPKLNDLGKKGFALPVSGDVTFINPSLQILEGSLLVATDINYSAESLSLVFKSERH